MYSILVTLRFNELKETVDGASKNRALFEEKQDNNFIQIEKELYNEISSIMLQKSKLRSSSWYVATKSKVVSCLKRVQSLKEKKTSSKFWTTIFKFEKRREKKWGRCYEINNIKKLTNLKINLRFLLNKL